MAASRRRRIVSVVWNAVTLLAGIVGVGLLLYPTVANWWNDLHQGYAVANYENAVMDMDTTVRDEMIAAAEAYNAELAKGYLHLNLSAEESAEYHAQLNVGEGDIMGYITIPKIDIELPIHHGTSQEVMVEAVGHIEGTSLPVGGKGTHCAVSGHRGLPSAKIFSDLDMLVVGDLFTVTVMDRVLTYEVDQVRIVMPDEIDELAIDPEQDYLTLVTCTPYGVNTHRLLVRGRRVETVAGSMVVLADAIPIQSSTVLLVLALPLLALVVVFVTFVTGREARYRRMVREVMDDVRRRPRR